MAKRVFESIMRGLEQAKAYEKGELKARTRTVKIEPVPTYTAKKVKELRRDLKLAQSAFAVICGVSVKTVEAWEAGTNTPSGAASRLFELFEKDPNVVTRTGILTVS